MIQYIAYNNLDYEKWDKCIIGSINGSVYAKSWYLDIVCEQWDALVLNDYEAVMPLPKRKKWGITYIYQPFMCQQLGVFHKQESYCVDDFISAIPKEILHFNFNLNTHNSSTICVSRSNVNYLLPLDKNIEELRANYSKSHLKNLRRANKHNLSIATVPDSAKQFSKNKRLLASSFMNLKQFELELNVINTSLELGKGEIFSVKGSQGNCCSVFVINDNKRLYLLSSYSNEEGKRKSAYFFLLDYIFSLEKFRGFVFDFEGSNLEGVA
ncbi:MAG: hypothetical protein ACPG5G_06590, partial [Flavobacteriales bacterium]